MVCAYQLYIHNYFYSESSIEDSVLLKEFLANNESSIENKNFTEKKQSFTADKCQVNEFFDPNMDTKEQLIQKGLSSGVVKNIINYRNKGGKFRVKKDLSRLYSLSKTEYQKIRSFIALPDTLIVKSNNRVLNKAPRKMVVSINSCSADSLEMLKGIGPVFAKRIVAFRSKLGGYYSLSQLSEVYGLPIETIELILPNLNLDTTQIKRIRLNSADVKALSKHPYISYKEAKAIVNYREQHGKFLQLATLRKLHIFKNKSINRLLPYLDLN